MYIEFYGLARPPFKMTPDPAFLFLTKQHREALAGLTYAIFERKGFLVLSGIAGSGKTTLLAWILQKLPAARVHSSVVLNPTLTPDEFLELVMLDFGIPEIPASKAQRLWTLQKFLTQNTGKVNVLIVDEAHKLTPQLLEEIRLLGNFERADEKLLQILLIGQPELDELLGRADLWQLKQRVSVRVQLEPLSTGEIDLYIRHRWRVAGGKTNPAFAPEAVRIVAAVSKGVPRLVNSICDNALVLAFADEAATVTAEHVNSAAADLRLLEKPAMNSGAPSGIGPVAASGFGPVEAPLLKTIEGYTSRPRKQSLVMRWAMKIGLA